LHILLNDLSEVPRLNTQEKNMEDEKEKAHRFLTKTTFSQNTTIYSIIILYYTILYYIILYYIILYYIILYYWI